MEKRVLIVDDEEKVVFFLRESLEELGQDFSIGTAGSAEEALEKIESRRYDLVISDLRMPGIDGLQLLERVKQKHPDTRFILMTAYGSDEVEVRAHSMEVYDYITKPFHVSDLIEVARHALADVEGAESDDLRLPEGQQESVNRALSNLRFEIGAQTVVLAEMGGEIICEVGTSQELETGTFIPLVANGLTSVSGMAQYLQDEETFNLNFYEGRKYDVYSTNVGDGHFLTLVFERSRQPSRIGMVWLYVKRTIQLLLRILHGLEEEVEAPLPSPEASAPLEPEPESEDTAKKKTKKKGDSAPAKRAQSTGGATAPADAQDDSAFGIEEALRKGLIDEDFAQLLKSEE